MRIAGPRGSVGFRWGEKGKWKRDSYLVYDGDNTDDGPDGAGGTCQPAAARTAAKPSAIALNNCSWASRTTARAWSGGRAR
mgnify:CR=1 FL=1